MVQSLKDRLAQFSARPLWQRRTLYGIDGALAGFGYFYFIGCASGTCPISSNPYVSAAYGALVGIFVPVQKKS